jgi:catechol 2,3-dioxygenase-like lactoylglutathione lyase family enzyme
LAGTSGDDSREEKIPWSGLHHVALVTPDLDATIRFYVEVLGLGLVTLIPASGARPRHCLLAVDSGDTSKDWLHFFEQPDATIVPYPLERGAVFPPELGALNHVALSLPDEASGAALQARLQGLGVPVTDVNTMGPVRNILFLDNNGLLLEAAWSA